MRAAASNAVSSGILYLANRGAAAILNYVRTNNIPRPAQPRLSILNDEL